jgi:hypothetical protein
MKQLLSAGTFRLTVLSIAFLAFSGIGAAQGKLDTKDKIKDRSNSFCSSENWSSDSKESYRELREMTVAAGGTLDVDSGRNGGISVKGENRSDILVRACVQAWGDTLDAAKAAVAGVTVSTAGGVRASGGQDENYSVSYQILVPRNTDLTLKAHNGGIAISSVEGNLGFETTNGGVSLSDIAGAVKGRTTNGGVNVSLTGNAWRGSGLDVQTSNGGVRVSLPDGYAANIETGTVNGGFRSDIAALNVENLDDNGRGRQRASKVSAPINGGGAPIRITTVNGGVSINSASGEKN